eukprot:153107-Pleurochrysis_carterae.AAC.1
MRRAARTSMHRPLGPPRTGVRETRRAVNFCEAAPSAHCGKVMRDDPWSCRRRTTSGKTHTEAWAASRNKGERGCPRSAGCSK